MLILKESEKYERKYERNLPLNNWNVGRSSSSLLEITSVGCAFSANQRARTLHNINNERRGYEGKKICPFLPILGHCNQIHGWCIYLCSVHVQLLHCRIVQILQYKVIIKQVHVIICWQEAEQKCWKQKLLKIVLYETIFTRRDPKKAKLTWWFTTIPLTPSKPSANIGWPVAYRKLFEKSTHQIAGSGTSWTHFQIQTIFIQEDFKVGS